MNEAAMPATTFSVLFLGIDHAGRRVPIDPGTGSCRAASAPTVGAFGILLLEPRYRLLGERLFLGLLTFNWYVCVHGDLESGIALLDDEANLVA
jgi:hypothetical protein